MGHGRVQNRFAFGLGTVGRDMLFATVNMFLLVYLTEILDLPDAVMWYMTGALTILRIFDALNDPIMGVLVDNTHSRHGKFKPWIAIGGLAGGLMTVLLFSDLGFRGLGYVASFVVIYLLWDLTYGANDIAYWSMLPALTQDQASREKIGSFAKICGSLGAYIVVVGILPITSAMGGDKRAWFLFAVAVSVLSLAFILFTLFGVKENRGLYRGQETTSLGQMFDVIFRNDQLLCVALAMAVFMIGYCTTTSFGVYYFKYAYKNEGMYSIFAGVLGVSQLLAFILFPAIAKRVKRGRLYAGATMAMTLGYLLMFLSPMNMVPIGIAGLLIFFGQAVIQMLMLMFLSDTVEYGQWKLGKRNESITFSIQPFINKIGAAIASGITSATLILTGINSAPTPDDVSGSGILGMKLVMLIFPLVTVVAGFFIYRKLFRIDKELYDKIVSELSARGDLGASVKKAEPS